MSDFEIESGIPIPDYAAFEPVSIRYEGKIAASHEMDLWQLGESIQGFAKAIAVAANFAYTGSTAVHLDALKVQVIATPTEEHHCFEVMAVIRPLIESKEFWVGAMGAAATIFAPIITYILSSRKSEEMKHLSDALKQSMAGNQAITDRLVSTVEKLAEALNPSVRKALAPIGKSCNSIDLYEGGAKIHSMDATTKAAFANTGSKVADHTKVFLGVISEFDMTNGACKVLLDSAAERVTAKVVDPVYAQPNNPYVSSMAAQRQIKFLAKYELDADGNLVKLHIFDTLRDEEGEDSDGET